jgi:hypothetical protein
MLSNCDRCQSVISNLAGFPDSMTQFENAAVITISGGYGMFEDFIDKKLDNRGLNQNTQKLICHDCAHKICDFLNIDTSNWHTHNSQLSTNLDILS